MIKEKDTYTVDGETPLPDIPEFSDPNNAVTIGSLHSILDEYIRNNSIPAVVAEDVLSYKVSLFKSAQAPCVIVSHAEKPKEFRKLVIIVKHIEGKAVAAAAWLGDSLCSKNLKEVEKLSKKSEKEYKKRQKYSRNSSLDEYGVKSLLSAGASMVNDKRSEHLLKKIEERKPVENSYHDSLISAAEETLNRIKELV